MSDHILLQDYDMVPTTHIRKRCREFFMYSGFVCHLVQLRLGGNWRRRASSWSPVDSCVIKSIHSNLLTPPPSSPSPHSITIHSFTTLLLHLPPLHPSTSLTPHDGLEWEQQADEEDVDWSLHHWKTSHCHLWEDGKL